MRRVCRRDLTCTMSECVVVRCGKVFCDGVFRVLATTGIRGQRSMKNRSNLLKPAVRRSQSQRANARYMGTHQAPVFQKRLYRLRSILIPLLQTAFCTSSGSLQADIEL